MDGAVDFEAFCHRHNTAPIRLLTLYCGDREMARVALNLANSGARAGRRERGLPPAGAHGPYPPRQRSAVLLRFLEDLSVEQTSELMGCSQGTVKKLTARALVELRATVAPEIEVDSDA